MNIAQILMEDTQADFDTLSAMAVSVLKRVGRDGSYSEEGASEKTQKAAEELMDLKFLDSTSGELTAAGKRALALADGGSKERRDAKEKSEAAEKLKKDQDKKDAEVDDDSDEDDDN